MVFSRVDVQSQLRPADASGGFHGQDTLSGDASGSHPGVDRRRLDAYQFGEPVLTAGYGNGFFEGCFEACGVHVVILGNI